MQAAVICQAIIIIVVVTMQSVRNLKDPGEVIRINSLLAHIQNNSAIAGRVAGHNRSVHLSSTDSDLIALDPRNRAQKGDRAIRLGQRVYIEGVLGN